MRSVRDWLSSLEAAGINLGLAQIRAVMAELGHPEQSFRSVTIAGTNGKGSVTAMVERGLRAAGLRTGRYTSPHLINIEERIAIDGETLAPETFDRAATLVRDAAERLQAPTSFFEATTAIALVAFRDAAVDVAVLEVGLGGRLDATNAVDSALAVITNIGLDHQDYLGDTIEAIAAEKAGVIKPGASVVAGRSTEAALAVLAERSHQQGASFLYAPDQVTVRATIAAHGSRLTLQTPSHDYGEVELALPGRHQVDNAVTAVRALELAGRLGFAVVGPEAIRTALAEVRWTGRLDWRKWRRHDVLIDGAHNPDGARALAGFVQETLGHRVPMVVGIMRDKAMTEILSALEPAASLFVLTAASTARAATPDELAAAASAATPSVPIIVAGSPEDALVRATALGSPVVVAGSLFLAGDVLALVA